MCDFRVIEELIAQSLDKLPYPQKTIIIDYRDTAQDCYPYPCALYFKRSVIDRTRMQRVATERSVLPITYAVRPNFYEGRPDEVLDHERDIDVGCFFSPANLEGHNKIRHQIARFLGSFCRLQSRYRIHTGIVGQPGRVGRNTLQANYFDMLKRCKIVVTCNPAVWEGDYRLYEALISGALVFVDRMLTPQPHHLLDRCHLVIFDARGDLEELEHKIEHYLEAPQDKVMHCPDGIRVRSTPSFVEAPSRIHFAELVGAHRYSAGLSQRLLWFHKARVGSQRPNRTPPFVWVIPDKRSNRLSAVH